MDDSKSHFRKKKCTLRKYIKSHTNIDASFIYVKEFQGAICLIQHKPNKLGLRFGNKIHQSFFKKKKKTHIGHFFGNKQKACVKKSRVVESSLIEG